MIGKKDSRTRFLNTRDDKILSVHNRGIEGLLNGYAMSYPIYEYFAIPNNVLAYLKGHHHENMFVFGRESLLPFRHQNNIDPFTRIPHCILHDMNDNINHNKVNTNI